MAQRVTISIVADASQADQIISKLNSQLGNIGSGAFKAQIDGVNKLSDGMLRAVQISDQLVRTGYRLTLGLSAPIIAATGYIVHLYSELEVARIAFTAFTGSVVTANQHLSDLYKFALTTPFTFSQVVQLSRTLQGVGFEATKVIPLLRSVGNAVALLGGGNDEIERVVNQLVHIQTLSRVTLRELNPIARAGIPVFAELADAIRKPGEAADETGRRIKNLLQKGLLPGPEFIKFFQSAQNIRFPEGLEKVSDSIKIRLSNLQDAVENAARVIGEAFAPAIKVLISSLSFAVNVLSKVSSLFGLLPEGIRTVLGLFIALLAVVGPLVYAVGAFSRALTSTVQLLNKITTSLDANTSATVAATAAANASATAKLKEAEASTVLTTALNAENAAQTASGSSSTLTGIFKNTGAYSGFKPFNTLSAEELAARNALREEISLAKAAEKSVIGKPGTSFLPGIFKSRIYDVQSSSETVAASLAEKALPNIASSAAVAANGLKTVATEASIAAVAAKGLFSSFGKFLSIASDIGLVLLAFQGIEFVTNKLKDIPGFGWLDTLVHALDPLENLEKIIKGIGQELKNLGISDEIKNFFKIQTSPQDLLDRLKPTKEQQFAIDKKNLQDTIDRNAFEKDRLTLLQDQLEVQRQARDFALDSQAKELAGSARLTEEFEKRISKATTQVHRLNASGLPEIVNTPLTAQAASDLEKGNISLHAREIEKQREETLAASQKLDDEIYKNRLEQLDAFTKASTAILDAAASSEILSVSATEKQKLGLRLSSLDELKNAELAHIAVIRTREYQATAEKIKDQGTEKEALDKAKALANTLVSPDDKSKEAEQTRTSIIKAELAIRQTQLNQYNAQLVLADKAAQEQTLTTTYQIEKEKFEVKLQYAEAANKLEIDLLNKQREAASSAVTSALAFQKDYLNKRSEAELKNLEFIQPASIQEELNIAKKQLEIRTNTAQQTYALEVQSLKQQAIERERKETEDLRRSGATDRQIAENTVKVRADADRESLQASISYFQELNNLQRDSALQQTEIIKNNTLSVFDTIRKSSDSLLDQLLSRSKSVSQAIGSALKSAFLTTFKEIISSQVAGKLTELTTGQKVQLQSSNVGTGPLAGLGNFLSRVAFGKPIVQSNTGGVPLPGPYDAQIKELQAKYDALVTKQPELEKLPTAPTFIPPNETGELPLALGKSVDLQAQSLGLMVTQLRSIDDSIAATSTGISDTLELLKVTLGRSDGIGYASLENGNVKVAIKNLETLAAKEVPQQKANIAAAETAAAGEAAGEDNNLLNKQLGVIGSSLNSFESAIIKQENANPALKNPGNLIYNNQLGASRVPGSDKAQFDTLEHGLLALEQQRDRNIARNLTLLEFFGGRHKGDKNDYPGYAPEFDNNGRPTGNHPAAYAAAVSKAIGVGVDVPLGDYYKALVVPQASNIIAPLKTLVPAIEALKDTIKQQNLGTVDAYKSLVLQEQKPTFSLNALQEQFRELTGTPTAVSRITKTPIYYVPGHEKDNLNAQYDKAHDVIQIFTPADQALSSIVHEDVHALLTKSHESIEALNELIPVDALKQANDVLKTRFTAYQDILSRQQEIIPRLTANQGGTLGLTQPEAETTFGALIKQLQSSGKGELASKLTQEHGAASAASYGDTLLSGPGNTLQSLISGSRTLSSNVLRDQAPTTQSTPSSLLPAAVSGVLGGAYGGVITGAAVGALAGVPRLLVKAEIDKVKQAVKNQFGVILDTKEAQLITDIINKKYGGDIPLGIRQPDVLQEIQEYAARTGQVFGAHNNKLPIGTVIGQKLQAAIPGLLSAGASFLPALSKSISGVIPGGGTPSLGITPTFTGQPEQLSGGNTLYDQQASVSTGTGVSNISDSIFQTLITKPGAPGSIGSRTDILEPLPGFVQINKDTGNLEGYGVNKQGEVGLITGQNKTGSLVGTILNQASSTVGGIKGTLAKFGGITGLVSKATGALGLGLISASSKFPTGSPAQVITQTAGYGSLGYSIGSSGIIPGVKGVKGGLFGAAIGSGISLVKDASGRGGVRGPLEGAVGGAIAGFGVAGPIGAAVGAVVGAVLGVFGPKSKSQQIADEVKRLYNLTIDPQFAKQLQAVIDQKYYGSISRAIRTKEILDMLSLYAQATGQKFGIPNQPRSSTLVQTQNGLFQQAIYEGNKSLSFAGVSVYGGVPTDTILPPTLGPTGAVLPYQGLPNSPSGVVLGSGNSGGSVAAVQSAPIIINNTLPENAVGSYMDGRTVRTIVNNPSSVSQSQIAAFKNNTNRKESIRLQLRPNEILS